MSDLPAWEMALGKQSVNWRNFNRTRLPWEVLYAPAKATWRYPPSTAPAEKQKRKNNSHIISGPPSREIKKSERLFAKHSASRTPEQKNPILVQELNMKGKQREGGIYTRPLLRHAKGPRLISVARLNGVHPLG